MKLVSNAPYVTIFRGIAVVKDVPFLYKLFAHVLVEFIWLVLLVRINSSTERVP